jgi:membrane-bound lytic murein transglycosylase D
MSLEKILDNQQIENEDKSPDISRRQFLRLGLTAATGAVITHQAVKQSFIKKAINFFRKSPEILANRRDEILSDEEMFQEEDIAEKAIIEPTVEQEKIEEQDARSLGEILDYKKDKIDLNNGTYKAVEAYWKERYGKGGKLRQDFEYAYKNIGEWEGELKKIFNDNGVPEKYIYLAIPESHWKLRARSRVGAAGPYQFIPRTAKNHKLKTGLYKGEHKNIDERMDPLKSAEACARELKYLYSKCNDWELALSGYNGGFFWKFRKDVVKRRNKGEDVKFNYEGFMEFLENKINNKKKEIEKMKNYSYRVRKGDYVAKIAKRFGISASELIENNKLNAKGDIRIGQKLSISVDNADKKKIYQKSIAGYSENLNYPAKFNAVISLIEDGAGVKQNNEFKFKTITIKNKPGITHKLTKGETFYSLHKRYGVSVASIEKANPGKNPNRVGVGTAIVIPNKTKVVTLFDIAKQNKKSMTRLKALNSSIVNFNKPLPNGFKVRI